MGGCFYANLLVVCVLPHPFPLSYNLGTLAGGLGCFPLVVGRYHPTADSRANVNGIRSLIGFGNLVRPLAQSVLYLRHTTLEAIPKYISERTSYLQV